MLSSQERRALRAAAHALRPVVLIGDQGVTDPVLREIDIALAAHELIKIRAAGQDRDERDQMLEQICETLGCAPVHHLGKTLIVYRSGQERQFFLESEEDLQPIVTPSRRDSFPHTPKKLAAQGIVLDKPLRKRRREGSIGKGEARGLRRGLGKKSAQGSARKSSARSGHKSAFSLRAGIRRSHKD
ncbi:YhbY family RNA-binding protein [Orrella sp. 11846]|uniref:YhbY family RNA-binding protein n=1 Tax=Orrella sp. 11846 TaxID=3409913 RepID=UPI003B5A2E34